MASLKEYGRSHPLFVATVGATGGLGGGFVAWIQKATTFFQFISVFFGSLVAIGAFVLTLPRIIRFVRNARNKGLANADRDSEPPFTV